jgi:hypothetical protein
VGMSCVLHAFALVQTNQGWPRIYCLRGPNYCSIYISLRGHRGGCTSWHERVAFGRSLLPVAVFEGCLLAPIIDWHQTVQNTGPTGDRVPWLMCSVGVVLTSFKAAIPIPTPSDCAELPMKGGHRIQDGRDSYSMYRLENSAGPCITYTELHQVATLLRNFRCRS